MLNILLFLDAVNVGFVVLTTLLYPLFYLISGFESSISCPLFLLEIVLVFAFLNSNFFIFFLYFELSLILLFYLILVQSSSSYKIRASFYLFLFSSLSSFIFSSCLFIFLIFFQLWLSTCILVLGFLFTFSFAIKIPLFPLHDWLSIVHSEASTSISLLFAGLMLKLGIFAILRFVFALFYMGLRYLSTLLLSLSFMGIILSLTSLFLYLDYKIIIALSSVAHMNLTSASIFAFSFYSVQCGIVTSIGHGFSSISLFLFAGFLMNKTMSRFLDSLWWLNFPLRFILFLLFLSNISFPGTLNFIAEILAFFSIDSLDFFLTFFTLILEALLSTSLSFLLYNRKITFYSFQFHLSFFHTLLFSFISSFNFFPGLLLLLQIFIEFDLTLCWLFFLGCSVVWFDWV